MIEKIKHWSEVFGLPVLTDPKFPDINRITLSYSLIKEELEELNIACIERDFTETQDALGDILWVTIRMMMELGIDAEKTIEAIYQSNMSKVDITEKDAILTCEKYKLLEIPTSYKKIGDYFITFRLSDTKIMKSHKFKEPEFNN